MTTEFHNNTAPKVTDFTFLDFTVSNGDSHDLSVHTKKSYNRLTFNKAVAKQIADGNYIYMRVRRDNVTSEHHLVLTKEYHSSCLVLKATNSSAYIYNKPLCKYLLGTFAEGESEAILHISDNLSNSEDYLTYKITAK